MELNLRKIKEELLPIRKTIIRISNIRDELGLMNLKTNLNFL